MARRGQETSAHQPRPETVIAVKERGIESEPEVEHVQFARCRSSVPDLRQSAWEELQNQAKAQQGSSHVQEHLNNISPDDRRHATLKRVEEGEKNNDYDRGKFARAQ